MFFARRSKNETKWGDLSPRLTRDGGTLKKTQVGNAEHSPPEPDDIDRTEQDKEQGQLDPWETNRHGERSKSSRRSPPPAKFKALTSPANTELDYFLNT